MGRYLRTNVHEASSVLIGFRVDDQHADGKKPVVSVDMDNPRVNTSNGESLFLADGTPSDYLTDIMGLLESYTPDMSKIKGSFKPWWIMIFLKPLLWVTLKDGSKNQLTGFTIKSLNYTNWMEVP